MSFDVYFNEIDALPISIRLVRRKTPHKIEEKKLMYKCHEKILFGCF